MVNTKTDNYDKPVISITSDTLEEAVEVLVRAFENDPIVNYFLSGHEKGYYEGARKLFGYQSLMYIEMELPIFGTVRDNRITGVVCLSGPEKKERSELLHKVDREFVEFMGSESFDRVKRYMNLKQKHTPKESHHYLAALGVHPDFQGQGFGGLLLEEIRKIIESHQTSTGVFLETAKLVNVDIYKHFGYKLLATEKLDEIVDLWYMFRPVEKND